jgi:beta-glucanase (GH16 family)
MASRAAASVAALAVAALAAPPSPPLGQQWVEVLHDDFSTLNTSLWTVRNNFTHGAAEYQLYLEEEVWVENGNLVIRTRYNPTQGPPAGPESRGMYNYTSGWLDSALNPLNKFEYGHFEWVAKLPNPNATGVWPTLWLVTDGFDPNSTRPWPVGGEIDVCEAFSGFQGNAVFGTYHYGSKPGVDDWDHYNQIYPNATAGQAPIDFSLDFHTFSATWSPDVLVWIIDDVQYEVRRPGDSPTLFIPSWPLYSVMNVALGDWGTPGRAAPSWTAEQVMMYVDSYTVWQLQPS